jgi:Flp pilus assembly protein TadD
MRHAFPTPLCSGLLGLLGLLGLAASCRDQPSPPPPPPPASALTPEPAPPAGAQVPVTTTSTRALWLFTQARDDADNTREAEAIDRFRDATYEDPKFAVAYAYLGYYQHGPEGEKSMVQALALDHDLPEPERLLIEELAALRAGDNEKARSLATRVAQLSPFDWHAQLDLGNRLFTEHRYAEAEQAFGKAAAFGPAAAVVFNELGYLYLVQRRFDPAVTEFRKYAELRPNEPNTFDSIGEALMAVGKLDEAEKSFRKAADMKFAFAWGGVAETRFLRGDWAGGMDALARSREAAVLPADKLDVDGAAFWATLAQHKTDDALARADALEKEAKDRGLDDQLAASSAYRAAALLDEGKAKDALEELGKTTPKLDKASSSTRSMLPVRRLTLVLRALAEARQGKGPEAEKTAAELAELAKKAPAQADYESMVPFGKGAAALARGDRKEAVARFRECQTEDLLCRRELLLVQEQAGDAAGAAATTAELLKVNLRDPLYVYVRSKIAPK